MKVEASSVWNCHHPNHMTAPSPGTVLPFLSPPQPLEQPGWCSGDNRSKEGRPVSQQAYLPPDPLIPRRVLSLPCRSPAQTAFVTGTFFHAQSGKGAATFLGLKGWGDTGLDAAPHTKRQGWASPKLHPQAQGSCQPLPETPFTCALPAQLNTLTQGVARPLWVLLEIW